MFNTYRMRRRVPELDFGQCWNLFHALARSGMDQDCKLMIALAERAVETAPQRSLRAASEGWANAYRHGSRVRFKSSPVSVLEPINDDLVEEIESAFQGDE